MPDPTLEQQVRAYLETCARTPWLDAAYHPTEQGALKIIPTRSDLEKQQVRDIFRTIMAGRVQGQRRRTTTAPRPKRRTT